MLKIYIARRLLKDSCYSEPIISPVAKESLVLYNLTRRAPETRNF